MVWGVEAFNMKVLLSYQRPCIVLRNFSPNVDNLFFTICFLFLSFASFLFLSLCFLPLILWLPALPRPQDGLSKGPKRWLISHLLVMGKMKSFVNGNDLNMICGVLGLKLKRSPDLRWLWISRTRKKCGLGVVPTLSGVSFPFTHPVLGFRGKRTSSEPGWVQNVLFTGWQPH